MKTSINYVMNNKTFKTLTAIAAELGIKRVYRKDFTRFGITEINSDVVATTTEVETPKAVETVEAPKTSEVVETVEEPNVKANPVENTTDLKSTLDTLSSNGLDKFKKEIAKFSTEDIISVAEVLNTDTYINISNKGIRRMRIIMALKDHYFPKPPKAPSQPSAFKDLSVEQLQKIAKDNNIEYKPCDNTGILKMRIIMALKDADVEAPKVNGKANA